LAPCGGSVFGAIADAEPGLQELKRHLEMGEWERRYPAWLALAAYDVGYRLSMADGGA
jgi:hypothetical protein